MGNRISFEGFCILSCGILRRELSHLRSTGFLNADEILYTEPGLHANRDELKSQLEIGIENAKNYSQNIIVVYGNDCHPKMDEIVQGENISRVEAENCIDMLADAARREKISGGKPGSIFWLSPGWLDDTGKNRDVWERIYKDFMGWEDADANVNFGTYEKAIFLDPHPLLVYEEYTPEQILEFSGWTHLPVVRQEITLDRLKCVLSKCVGEIRV